MPYSQSSYSSPFRNHRAKRSRSCSGDSFMPRPAMYRPSLAGPVSAKRKKGFRPPFPLWPPIRRLPSSPPPEDQRWGQCASQGTMIDPWPNHTVWPALSVALVLAARLTTGAAVKPPKPTTSLLYTPIGRLVHRELDKRVTIVRTPAAMLACLASHSFCFDATFYFPPSAAWQRSCPSGYFVVRTCQSLWHS